MNQVFRNCGRSRYNNRYQCDIQSVHFLPNECQIHIETRVDNTSGPLQSPYDSKLFVGSSLNPIPFKQWNPSSTSPTFIKGFLTYESYHFIPGRSLYFQYGSNGYTKVLIVSNIPNFSGYGGNLGQSNISVNLGGLTITAGFGNNSTYTPPPSCPPTYSSPNFNNTPTYSSPNYSNPPTYPNTSSSPNYPNSYIPPYNSPNYRNPPTYPNTSSPNYPNTSPNYPNTSPNYPNSSPNYPNNSPYNPNIYTPINSSLNISSSFGGYTPRVPLNIQRANFYGNRHPDTRSFDHFNMIPTNTPYPVRQIKLWGRNFVNGIQVFYEMAGCTPAEYGNQDQPYESSLVLESGEYIVDVSGKLGEIIDSMEIRTNRGRVLRHGGNGGHTTFRFSIPSNSQIVGFYGGFGGHLHNIGIFYTS